MAILKYCAIYNAEAGPGAYGKTTRFLRIG